MQTSINLQEPFTYSIVPFIILVCFILGMTIYFWYTKKAKQKGKIEVNHTKVIPQKNIKDISAIKNKYKKQLNEIENDYQNQKIEIRKAYQLISQTIRLFVFEVTDITTQNYSLIEIQKLNMPNLYELIKEYYEPEFASKSIGDFGSSICKARRVIDEWK